MVTTFCSLTRVINSGASHETMFDLIRFGSADVGRTKLNLSDV